MFAMIGFVSTSHASNEIYLESGDTHFKTLQSSDDKQWYQIDTTQDNSDISIYLSYTTAPIRFTLYDSYKKYIIGDQSSHFEKLKAGTYDLIATYSAGSVNHDTTTFEPNDTRENAFPVKSNVSVKSQISNGYDQDFIPLR